MSARLPIFAVAIACIAQSGQAQMSAPPIPSVLPNVNSISAGNAAGVLKYCASHGLVSVTRAGTVLDKVSKNEALLKSPDYSAGQAGRIIDGHGKSFSVAQAPSHLRSQACDLVLRRAQRLH